MVGKTEAFVVLIRQDLEPNTLEIVGPFASPGEASDFGQTWDERHGNPNWNMVLLPAGFVPRIMAPEAE